jgi:hypothetical protein
MSVSFAKSSMPTRSQLVNHVAKINPVVFECEESLVDDERSSIRPAQMVERKLTRLTKNSCLLVSQLRLKDLLLPRT